MGNNQKSSIEASIIIDASIENVWKVLTDFPNLKNWSSSFIGLQGNFGKNGEIEIQFKTPMGLQKMKRQVFHFEEGKAFGWTGVFMLGMKDCHLHTLEAISAKQTKFTQTDYFSGGASFLLKGILHKQLKKSYDVFNQELKKEVEESVQ